MPMETESPPRPDGAGTLQFSRLWETGASLPASLSHFFPPIWIWPTSGKIRYFAGRPARLDGGGGGKSIPLRIYLSAFPKIASRGEMVRAPWMASGSDTCSAEIWAGRTRPSNPNTLDVVSEAPTHPIEGEPQADDTQVESDGPYGVEHGRVREQSCRSGQRSTILSDECDADS